MELVKQILIDSLNGFSADMIPLFLFQLLVAGLLGHLVQKIVNRKFEEGIVAYGALLAMSIALLTSMVKYSLPFSVIAAAVLLFLIKSKEFTFERLLGLFLLGLIGVGCGIGSVIQTGLGFILIALIILFTPVKK